MGQLFSGAAKRSQSGDVEQNESNLAYVISRGQSFNRGGNCDERCFSNWMSERPG